MYGQQINLRVPKMICLPLVMHDMESKIEGILQDKCHDWLEGLHAAFRPASNCTWTGRRHKIGLVVQNSVMSRTAWAGELSVSTAPTSSCQQEFSES